jgi:cysteinyl-tRNA synthetase
LAELFEAARRAHVAADAGDPGGASTLADTVATLAAVLGLGLRSRSAQPDEHATALARRRDEARVRRDWAQADALRAELAALGWRVEDGPDGTVIRR